MFISPYLSILTMIFRRVNGPTLIQAPVVEAARERAEGDVVVAIDGKTVR